MVPRLCGLLLLSILAACTADEERPAHGGAAGDERGLQFSTDWVSSNEEVWLELLQPLIGQPEIDYLEIGVWEGRSFIWMLDHVLTHPSSRATGIDPFTFGALDHESIFRSNVRKAGHAKRVTTLVGTSEAMMRDLPRASFELIYVDGSHKASDVLLDAAMSWTLLAPGGILIFDDYGWLGPSGDGNRAPDEMLPRPAIDAFLTANRNAIEVLHRDYQLAVRKKANPCAAFVYCTPLARYLYLWEQRVLAEAETRRVVELTPAERGAIEDFLRSRSFGQVALDFAEARAASPVFAALADRLALEPSR